MQVTKTFASCKVFVMYCFTHINIVYLFRHLPIEIVIFINVCHQMKCFSGDGFSFFWEQVLLIFHLLFLISCEVRTRYSKTLKYSEQYIRDHLSGARVRIWICSEYDAGFNFSCIALCSLTKSLLFRIISIIRIRLGIFQTVNLYFVCL